MASHRPRAFTLVELLVVIAIVAILVALLIPAVNAAREAARQTQCASNHKQVALATLNHVAAHDRLPALIPQAFKHRPKGIASWRITILPYLEEQALYDVLSDGEAWDLIYEAGEGIPSEPAHVPPYQCPSTPGSPVFIQHQVVTRPSGELIFDLISTEETIAPQRVRYVDEDGVTYRHAGTWLHNHDRSAASGDVTIGAKLRYVIDGLSQTILIGEQAGPPKRYVGGKTPDKVIHDRLWATFFSLTDSSGAVFVSQLTPTTLNLDNQQGVFGFHRGAYVSFCDGAVRYVPEHIDPKTFGSWLARDDQGLLAIRRGRPE